MPTIARFLALYAQSAVRPVTVKSVLLDMRREVPGIVHPAWIELSTADIDAVIAERWLRYMLDIEQPKVYVLVDIRTPGLQTFITHEDHQKLTWEKVCYRQIRASEAYTAGRWIAKQEAMAMLKPLAESGKSAAEAYAEVLTLKAVN